MTPVPEFTVTENTVGGDVMTLHEPSIWTAM